jgi:hypothetical protein
LGAIKAKDLNKIRIVKGSKQDKESQIRIRSPMSEKGEPYA